MNTRNEKGYTLVELGITLAVIGIAATVAIPNFRGVIERYRFNSAVQVMTTEVNLTRLKAISLNREYQMRLDKSNETYMIREGNLSSDSTAWSLKASYTLPAGTDMYAVESLSESGDAVIFRPDGSMNEGATVNPPDGGRISLQSKDGVIKKRIVINGITGRVTVERDMGGGVWKDERYLKE